MPSKDELENWVNVLEVGHPVAVFVSSAKRIASLSVPGLPEVYYGTVQKVTKTQVTVKFNNGESRFLKSGLKEVGTNGARWLEMPSQETGKKALKWTEYVKARLSLQRRFNGCFEAQKLILDAMVPAIIAGDFEAATDLLVASEMLSESIAMAKEKHQGG
ncbi:MAG: hypothetical protein IBX50_04135 [Marinospirillum sp.]|uniref:hypothetical protein n=1 Tax=Marinospirillum sp. TaxID=2183934 RepID=UPI0019E59470|nr:hypothetical protein [Marinospirillum sp.]MBE0505895.1 hypothetical protein [Marinospirillum sp.]